MTVLHILTQSLPYIVGNTIRTMYIVRYQKKNGITPIVLTSPLQGESNVDNEEIDGIVHFRTHFPAPRLFWPLLKISLVRHIVSAFVLYRKACTLINREHVQIVHAHSPATCGLAGLLAARRARIRFVYEVRGFWHLAGVALSKYGSTSPGFLLRSVAEKLVIRKADYLVTIGTNLKREVIRMGGNPARITLIPNGVEPQPFLDERKTSDPDVRAMRKRYLLNGCTVLGYIGSPFYYEGVDMLVSAFGKMAKDSPSLRLLIVGDIGEDVIPRSFEDSICRRIIFTGSVPHHEVSQYYRLMDILCYPRVASPLTQMVTPLKPFEAMASGKAIIASDLDAFREFIEDGVTGVLFPWVEPFRIRVPSLDPKVVKPVLDELIEQREGLDKLSEPDQED